MKKVFILLAIILAVASFQILEAQNVNKPKPFVHCLVLDKTLSMTGHGGTDIWADVQDYCCDWVDGIPQSSTILFFTYDKDLFGPQRFVINSESDRQKAKDAIRGVVVDGRHTWISSNLNKAVDYVYENFPKSNYNNMIYLITDGIEEQPESDFAGVLSKYDSRRGDYDHLYYVDLRDMASEATKEIIDNNPNVTITPGFTKFVTVRPDLPGLSYFIGKSKKLEQTLIVSSGEVAPGQTFSIVRDSVVRVDGQQGIVNVNISPSMNISFENLTKTEEGKYSIVLDVDFLNNSECECDIFVSLKGSTQAENVLTFEPSVFCIQARKAAPPTISLKKDKSGQPMGWHFKK